MGMGTPLDLVTRVELGLEEVAVHIDLSRFLAGADAEMRHLIPARIRRRGVESIAIVFLHGWQSVPGRSAGPVSARR